MENTEVITLLKEAFELKRQEKYKHAMELLYKALALCPENVEILSQIAEIHMLLNNPQSAGSIYERLASKQIDDAEVMTRLCTYYMSIFSFDKAKLLLEKFILAYPSQKAYETYLNAYFSMNIYEKVCETYKDKKLENYHSTILDKIYAIALYKTDKVKDAEKILANIAKNNHYDDEIQYYYAQALYTLGNSKKSYEVALNVVNEVENHKLYNLCGEMELDNEYFEAAIKYFLNAIKLKADGRYFYNLATAYFLNGQLEEAKGCYLKSISISPDIDEYRYSLAYLFYKQNDLKKARQIIEEILKRQPNFRDALFLQVNILYDEHQYFNAERVLTTFDGDKDRDEEYLKLSTKVNKALYKTDATILEYGKLIKLRPDIMDYRLELARLFFDKQKYSNSAQLVVSIMSESPKYVSAYLLAAKIYIKMFDFKNVVKMAQKVLNLDLNNEEAFYIKALGQVGLQKIDDAILTTKQLLAYNPYKSEAYALLGTAYIEKEEYEVAEKYYKEAISVDPKNADYFLNLAVLQDKLNNPKEALRHLYIAHSLSPDNKQINTKLVEFYVKNKLYKNAMKLLRTQINTVKEFEIKKEYISQLKDIESLYRKSEGLIKYIVWQIYKILSYQF